MDDNRNKWLSSRCTSICVCVIGVGGHAEAWKNAAGLATSAPVCPCEGAEEEKGWGNRGLGSEGCHLMLTTDQSESPRLSRTAEERGVGQLRGRPRRSIISSKETPSANIQISFAQLRPDYTHLSMRRATPRRQLMSCLNDMRICHDSSCSLETRTDPPTR